MSIKAMILWTVIFSSCVLFADEQQPVAAGFPVWSGISPKNYISGRALTSNAELRQRITVVVEFDSTKCEEQLAQAGALADLNEWTKKTGLQYNWMHIAIPHDVLVIFTATQPDADVVRVAIKEKKEYGFTAIRMGFAPVYRDVTFEGAPKHGGRLPFVYVMGYEGVEPIVKEPYSSQTMANVRKAIADQRKKLSDAGYEWRSYYGYVKELKHFSEMKSVLAKGKPLAPFEAKLLKSVRCQDGETAKEAQMLYDALAQTRGDLLFRADRSFLDSPYVAAYDVQCLLRYWPQLKKDLADLTMKLSAWTAAKPLIVAYPKLVEWSDPDFTCKSPAAAKKIVVELNKMKKAFAPLKENGANIVIQNGSSALDALVDELIVSVPTKAEK